MRRPAGLAAFAVSLAACLTSPGIGSAFVQAPDQLPGNVVAVVFEVPPALGRVTAREFHRAVAQAAAPRSTPRPGSARYERVKHSAMESALEMIWIQGQAAEMRIEVSAAEVSRAVARIKRQNFHGYADYRRFLREYHYSPHDVYEHVKVQVLATRIQERVLSKAQGSGQQALEEFLVAYRKRWRERTICATGHIVRDYCSNG